MSEKRLVRARGQALRSPNTGAHGASAGRALPRFVLTHRFFFFGPELGSYQHLLALQRSILEHVSICSPSQFVHLHGKPYRLFFERELDGTAPISVRVIAIIGITQGRKPVSPSRNPCDSDHFLVVTHNQSSPSWDPHRFFFFGPAPERNRINWDRSPVSFLYIYRRASACC